MALRPSCPPHDIPLPSENLLFDGTCYDLGWDEKRHLSSQVDLEVVALPSPDYARYLIHAVQFHCGKLFHHLEEDRFMQCFSLYHENALDPSDLWYFHFLLILAFGKAFVVQTSRGRKPPGADLFRLAMSLLPPAHMFVADAIHMVQILCCAALYLQCLDFRGPAYRIRQIGQALRLALQGGLHTEMHGQDMSSLMGVPMAISDGAINAPLPTFPGEPRKSMTLEMQIKLSRVLVRIVETVYRADGRLDKQFLSSTKDALKNIAGVADHLNGSFALPNNAVMRGISRVSASLHLMQHQCIVLTTRPLLYSLFESRIGGSDPSLIRTARSGSVRNLLLICIDSAQQMLTILASLQSQDILEGFLRFDLDATFTAHLTLLMAPTIDPTLIKNQSIWLKRSYSVLEYIISCGNMVAVQVKSELRHLDDILSRWPMDDEFNQGEAPQQQSSRSSLPPEGPSPKSALPQPMIVQNNFQPLEDTLQMEGVWWQEGLSSEYLINFANSIDLDSLDIL
ncbi:hypothetical protein BDV36DRAFT_298852 [Aspergillus pseudocaelatus]|uniref:Transcription factor domain-containing protein n=1 Tax=Aspergillus pseudocaelatus TaxID=1825620 RepID=A0ABQ6WEN5_9EURO|nr:hypothetical protein BDV36DRAFT_298852 [Aspergillus pseudocaelatus]